MQATQRKRIILIVSSIAILIALVILFRYAFSSSAKTRITNLLHLGNKVSVKNDTQKLTSTDLMKKYYDVFGYNEMWSQPEKQDDQYRNMLLNMLDYADSLGLNRADYHADFISRYDSMIKLPEFDYDKYKTESEVIFTDAALSFLYNVAYGKEINTEFNGVKYNIDSTRILNVYNQLMQHRNWRRTLDSIEPKIEQYLTLKNKLNYMRAFVRDFPETDTLVADNTDGGTIIAGIKLRFYGIISDSLAADSSGKPMLKAPLIAFQKMMSIDTSGKLDDKTLKALNFPLPKRMAQMKESLNYWRWTGRLQEKEFILVNLPAARLQVVNPDSVKDLTMRVIVGKTATQTPSFTAYITKVIAYPYWTVPVSIATKEMLPKIQKRIAYLDENNLQVFDAKGKIIDPATVNWGKYTAKYFPFTIRQSTGCDNSLGVLKFDLNSPFSIYLHDTNHRELFARSDRFMSHGCVRVEKPMELANYVLKDGLDSATIQKLNQCLHDQTPKEFPLAHKFPVLILYMTADIDANGNLKFYNDVYKLDEDLVVEKPKTAA